MRKYKCEIFLQFELNVCSNFLSIWRNFSWFVSVWLHRHCFCDWLSSCGRFVQWNEILQKNYRTRSIEWGRPFSGAQCHNLYALKIVKVVRSWLYRSARMRRVHCAFTQKRRAEWRIKSNARICRSHNRTAKKNGEKTELSIAYRWILESGRSTRTTSQTNIIFTYHTFLVDYDRWTERSCHFAWV